MAEPGADPQEHRARARPTRRALLGGGVALALGGATAGGTWWARRDAPTGTTADSTSSTQQPSASTGGAPSSGLAPFPADAGVRHAFARDEQVLAPYAVTLPALAAAATADPAHRGWFAGGFWRRPDVPGNARVQENVATLAWFYTQPRAWNPYRGDPALRTALEAALGWYLGLQDADGSFPEGPGASPRAATGFALVYLGQTSDLLEGAALDEALRRRLLAATLRAVDWFLDPGNADVWESAVHTSNQVVAGLLGCARLRDRLGAARRDRLAERTGVFLARAQSPAGYPYENRSVDFGYTTGVTLGDLAELITVTGDRRLVALATRAVEFCSYNYLWEPGGEGFVVNGGIGARQSVTFLDAERTDFDTFTDPLALVADRVDLAAGLLSTREARDEQRTAWADDPAPLPALAPGTVDPMRPRHVLLHPVLPTRAERLRALDRFRYRAETDFVERRDDPGFDQHHVYVRRPGCYTGASWGRLEGRQRAGLGFLWSPAGGTFLCTQPTPGPAWGCLVDGQDETTTVLAGAVTRPGGGADPQLTLRSADGRRARTVRLRPDGVAVTLRAEADLVETLPLVLQEGDVLSWLAGDGTATPLPAGPASATAAGLRVVRGPVTLVLALPGPARLALAAPSATLFRGDRRTVRALSITAGPALGYEVRLQGGSG